MGIQSIAMPALGCGLGGLKWSEVQPLIVNHLGALPDLDVYVYEPQNVDSIIADDQELESQTKTAKEKISARPRELEWQRRSAQRELEVKYGKRSPEVTRHNVVWNQRVNVVSR